MKLLIVQSQAVARKLNNFLGSEWRVEASPVTVRDLPKKLLGIDIYNNFQPRYEVPDGESRHVQRVLWAIYSCEAIYLATAPTREGEAVAWHLLELAQRPHNKPVFRVHFSTLSEGAVRAALDNPSRIDLALVEAGNANRIVDRLIGYLAGPFASKTLKGNYAVGRVQSLCLNLLVKREEKIRDFQPQSQWTMELRLQGEGEPFDAELMRVEGTTLPIKTQAPLERLAALLKHASFWATEVATQERIDIPPAPFTTTTLQQAAAHHLHLTSQTTTGAAQRLYETGLITYPQTDSTRVATEAQAAARDYIRMQYGAEYLPVHAPIYSGQSIDVYERLEAIRPTDINVTPEQVEIAHRDLYQLIWRRFIASQMDVSRESVTVGRISTGKHYGQEYPLEFRAAQRRLTFDGFRKVYIEGQSETLPTQSEASPRLNEGQSLTLVECRLETCPSDPPKRFDEASLIQALESYGITHLSTYAGITVVLRQQGYVELRGEQIVPTDAGVALAGYLRTHFAPLLDEGYNVWLESSLDAIALGARTGTQVLHEFWDGFRPLLAEAAIAFGQEQRQGLYGDPRQVLASLQQQEPHKPILFRPMSESGS